ncbi:MAG: peptide deformylase [Gammaproteobacteria bacterium]|nr:peptide deformylase [Gammaproteobacteria bacterium]
MAVLKILVYPDPRLARVSQAVTVFDKELCKFVDDLEATMRAGPGGVGIAASQVDVLQRIVIVDVSSKPKISSHGRLVLVNPQIVVSEGSLVGREGCMSVPDYTGNVVRARTIQVVAQDEFGERQEYLCEGYEARAVQHEIDHLDGLLFLDRLVSRRRDLFRRKT